MYFKAIFVNESGDGYQTGSIIHFDSKEAANSALESLKTKSMDTSAAPFFIDLWASNGDLMDSVSVSKEVYTEVMGKPVLTEEEYRVIDKEFWEQVERHGAIT